jgi:MurNAc alpha-1-phosphate uridylyltransferase
MIFAAGLGTRLRPLTDSIPKALVEVGGVPMLERVARRLVAAGATRLIINAHHHAGLVKQFVAAKNGFGVEALISDESGELLDTGGGLKHAAPLFRGEQPFLLHNGDVVADFDLAAFYAAHCRSDALATLAVNHREVSRYLAFDAAGYLCGYGNAATGLAETSREPAGAVERLGFCGVHVISNRIFDLISEQGVFSIIALYLRLSRQGFRIAPYSIDGSTWIDIGKPDQLAEARKILSSKF